MTARLVPMTRMRMKRMRNLKSPSKLPIMPRSRSKK